MRTLDNKLKSTFLNCLVLVGTMGLISCGKKQDVPPPPRVAPPAPIAPPVAAESKEKPVYVYGGDRFRDLFTPAGASTSYQSEAVFDPKKATVRGIIYSTKMKSAVMTATGSGAYFIKNGQIFDVMGKTVKGFSAKILLDRVILTDETDNIFELKLKTDEQEAKTL